MGIGRRFGLGVVGILLIALGIGCGLAPAWAADAKVSFVLLNDLYRFDGTKERGGMARVAAVIKAERSREKNTIVAHAGDFISPSLLSGFDRGAHMVKLLNMTPVDLFVPGNHEFDFGPEVFLARMGELNATRLAANLRDPQGKMIPGFADTKIFDMDGVKIGVVGIALDDTPAISSSGDYRFSDSLKSAALAAKALRDEGADFLVAVVHLDRERDMQLTQSGQFDLILSGHNHDLTVFFNGRSALVESKVDGEFVTSVDVSVHTDVKDGRKTTTFWPNFRITDTATVTPDPDVAATVESYRRKLAQELDVEVGRTEGPLDSRKAAVRSDETAIGNLIADALRAATHADVAITNGGGIRGNREYPAGSAITRRDILSELPFGNRTVVLELTGEAILTALENGVSVRGEEAGRFPQVSGLKVVVDLAKPAGSRVISAEIAGKPVDPKAIYRLATNDFMARGGDGYRVFANARAITAAGDGTLMAADVMAYIASLGKVTAAVEGRIVLNGK